MTAFIHCCLLLLRARNSTVVHLDSLTERRGLTSVCLCVPLFDKPPHHLLLSPQLLVQGMYAFLCIRVHLMQNVRVCVCVCRHAITCVTTLMWMPGPCLCTASPTAVHFSHFSDTQIVAFSIIHCESRPAPSSQLPKCCV